jgi:thiol:disulfide interchange protein DsbC
MNFRGLIFILAAVLAVGASADEGSVKRGIEGRFGGIKVSSVTKTPYAGLYEVVVGETISTPMRR